MTPLPNKDRLEDIKEDVAEIVINHFPHASRLVLQEVQEEILEIIAQSNIELLEGMRMN